MTPLGHLHSKRARDALKAPSSVVFVCFVDGPFLGKGMLFANPERAMRLGHEGEQCVYVRQSLRDPLTAGGPPIAYYALAVSYAVSCPPNRLGRV